jgi:hypothetical protein
MGPGSCKGRRSSRNVFAYCPPAGAEPTTGSGAPGSGVSGCVVRRRHDDEDGRSSRTSGSSGGGGRRGPCRPLLDGFRRAVLSRPAPSRFRGADRVRQVSGCREVDRVSRANYLARLTFETSYRGAAAGTSARLTRPEPTESEPAELRTSQPSGAAGLRILGTLVA